MRNISLRLFYFFLLTISYHGAIYADFLDRQEICSSDRLRNCLAENLTSLVVDIPGDVLSTAIFPLSRERITRTAFDFGATFAVMPFDEKISPSIWQISDWSGDIGMRPQSTQNWYIPGFLFFDSIMSYALPVLHTTAAFIDDRRLYRATYLGMKVWAYSIIVPIPFRYLVQRSYPYASNGELNSPYEFQSGDFADRNQSVLRGAGSFPSFRAAMWFGLADVFAEEYGKHWAWYTVATSLTLLADHRHWASDLFFGSLVGLSVSKSIRTRYGEDSHGGFYTIFPVVGKNFFGITLNARLR